MRPRDGSLLVKPLKGFVDLLLPDHWGGVAAGAAHLVTTAYAVGAVGELLGRDGLVVAALVQVPRVERGGPRFDGPSSEHCLGSLSMARGAGHFKSDEL